MTTSNIQYSLTFTVSYDHIATLKIGKTLIGGGRVSQVSPGKETIFLTVPECEV